MRRKNTESHSFDISANFQDEFISVSASMPREFANLTYPNGSLFNQESIEYRLFAILCFYIYPVWCQLGGHQQVADPKEIFQILENNEDVISSFKIANGTASIIIADEARNHVENLFELIQTDAIGMVH